MIPPVALCPTCNTRVALGGACPNSTCRRLCPDPALESMTVERTLALVERDTARTDRDTARVDRAVAFIERDASWSERDVARKERDVAVQTIAIARKRWMSMTEKEWRSMTEKDRIVFGYKLFGETDSDAAVADVAVADVAADAFALEAADPNGKGP